MAVDLDGCISLGSSANPGMLTMLHIFMTILLTISQFRTLENILTIQEAHPDAPTTF